MLKVLVIFLFCLNLSFAQNKKYEFAKSYLENGKFDDAARLFQELLDETPNNQLYFQGLFKSLYSVNKFKELLPITQNFLKVVDDDFLRAYLGDLYQKNGLEDDAKITWKNLLAKKYDLEIYQIVANLQKQNRLLKDALETYKLARSNERDKSIFNDEIVKIYISLGDYENGFIETMLGLEITGNIPSAQGRLFAFLANPKSKDYIKSNLELLSNKNKDDYKTQELLAWFYNSINDYSSAFEVHKRIDDITSSEGAQIYTFGENARKDKNFETALKCFEFIIDNKQKYKRYLRAALLSYALTLEDKFGKDVKISNEKSLEIIKRYEQIIDENEKSMEAAEANYRIGQIYSEWLNDKKKGNQYFKLLIEKYGKVQVVANAGLDLVKNYLMDNNFKEAEFYSNFVISSFPKNMIREIDEANYYLGLMKYFEGNFADALAALNIITDSKSDLINNAYELKYFISENIENQAELTKFSQIDFAKFQKDTISTINLIEEFLKNNSKNILSEKAEIIRIDLLKSSSPNDAIIFIDEFILNYPKSIYKDKILFTQAEIFISINQNDKATNVLNKLLIEHSDSIYLQAARDLIRKIRGEI